MALKGVLFSSESVILCPALETVLGIANMSSNEVILLAVISKIPDYRESSAGGNVTFKAFFFLVLLLLK